VGAVSLADANGDGRLDLFAARTSIVTVRLGSGDGTFGAGMDFAVPAGAVGITVGVTSGAQLRTRLESSFPNARESSF